MCLPPLIGRDTQRRQIRTATTPGTLLLLSGPAGTGKTRLVQELHQAEHGTVLTGHCPPHTEPAPYAPLIEALHHATIPTDLTPLCGALSDLMPEHAPHLPPPPSQTAHHHIHRAFTELLHALGPTLLVLEDVQWIDPHTRDLLHHLTPQLPPTLSLTLTYRPEELPSAFPVAALATRIPPTATHHHITLDHLSPEHVHTLARHHLGPHITHQDTHHLHTWTGGHPLSVVQTLHHLAHHPTDPLIGPTPPVPAPLRDWILTRLHRLHPDTRRILHAAGVLNTPATEDDLSAVAHLNTHRARKALAQARRLGLLHPLGPTTLAPATPLLAHVCHHALPHDQHRRLHRAALTLLSRRPDPDHTALARHAREAGAFDTWTDHAEQAADTALAHGEDTTAVQLLSDALTRHDLPPTRRCALALKLGRAALTGIHPDHTITLLRHTLHTPGLTTIQRGELRMELGLLLLNQASQNHTARSELVRAVAELSSRPALAARAMCALAVPCCTPDSVTTHRRWMEQAVRAADRSQDTDVQMTVRVNHATLLAQIGDPTAWDMAPPRPGTAGHPRTPARDREFARACLNLADAAVMLGHYDRADHHLAHATDVLTRTDVPYIHESAGALHLMLDWARGHWDDLAQRTELDLRSPRLARLHAVTAELTIIRAALALAHGEHTRARTHLDRLHPTPDLPESAEPDHSVPVLAFAAGLRARMALAQGHHTTAWQHVQALVALVAGKGIWVWAADLVPGIQALIWSQRPAIAQDLCVRFRAGLRGTNAPAAQAALLRLEATLAHHQGHHDKAQHLYAQCAAAYKDMPRPYDAALVTEEAARAHLNTNEHTHEPALTTLGTTLEQYTHLGASWDATRLRRLLREHGVSTPAPRSHGEGDPRLSPRENEVTTLAAHGHTNRQIADLLHLSTRTVETHVANALAKLGLRSRRELPPPTPTTHPHPPT